MVTAISGGSSTPRRLCTLRQRQLRLVVGSGGLSKVRPLSRRWHTGTPDISVGTVEIWVSNGPPRRVHPLF